MILDTIDRIATVHMAAITSQPFVYKNEEFKPQPLRVSPLIFRGFLCPASCGACCKPVSLDWLPSEELPYVVESREIEFNGHKLTIFSDLSSESPFCHNLQREDARCAIHGKHPYSCDFEMIRVGLSRGSKRQNALSNRLFGRGWALTRVDGSKGAACSMTPVSKEEVPNLLRKLRRMQDWANFFKLTTVLPDIIAWVETGPHEDALYLNQEFATLDSIALPILSRSSAHE